MTKTMTSAVATAAVGAFLFTAAAGAETLVIPSRTMTDAEGMKVTMPKHVVVSIRVEEPLEAAPTRLPFVGGAPFDASAPLPKPFVGERPERAGVGALYFGERPAKQPPCEATSVQIPEPPRGALTP